MARRTHELDVPEGYLLVGLVHKPHGIKGEVSVELLGDEPSRLHAGSRIFVSLRVPVYPIEASEGTVSDERKRDNLARGDTPPESYEEPRPVTVRASRFHRGRYIVKIEGVDDRNAAESFRDAIITIPETEAAPKTGQVFLKDLYGLSVVDKAGRELGRVVSVLTYPAQDVLEIETQTGKKLLPLVRELVPEVDLESGKVVVDPPAGIFEGDPA
jgi:16S rRNA processing protein RimM